MSEKERNAVENVVRGRQPVLVPLPVSHFFFCFSGVCTILTLDIGPDIRTTCSSFSPPASIFCFFGIQTILTLKMATRGLWATWDFVSVPLISGTWTQVLGTNKDPQKIAAHRFFSRWSWVRRRQMILKRWRLAREARLEIFLSLRWLQFCNIFQYL